MLINQTMMHFRFELAILSQIEGIDWLSRKLILFAYSLPIHRLHL
jgi:hypothetical protein